MKTVTRPAFQLDGESVFLYHLDAIFFIDPEVKRPDSIDQLSSTPPPCLPSKSHKEYDNLNHFL